MNIYKFVHNLCTQYNRCTLIHNVQNVEVQTPNHFVHNMQIHAQNHPIHIQTYKCIQVPNVHNLQIHNVNKNYSRTSITRAQWETCNQVG